MTPDDKQASGALHLGPFAVRAGNAEVEAFRRETGAGGRVPFTFPVRWLAHPQIRAAATQMLGDATCVPMHESQYFDYSMPLECDTDYCLEVEMSREIAPPRLTLRAELTREAGKVCLNMEMILRIVDLQADGPVGTKR